MLLAFGGVGLPKPVAQIEREITKTAWYSARQAAGIEDFRFPDLRHAWAPWHPQAGTSCDERKDLGGWKSRVMVDRYAKYATEHLAVAASRIQRAHDESAVNLVTFSSRRERQRA